MYIGIVKSFSFSICMTHLKSSYIMLIIVILFHLLNESIAIIDSSEHIYISILQHELLRVLYPVFIHCFMELVARGHIQEGILYQLCFGCILIFVR